MDIVFWLHLAEPGPRVLSERKLENAEDELITQFPMMQFVWWVSCAFPTVLHPNFIDLTSLEVERQQCILLLTGLGPGSVSDRVGRHMSDSLSLSSHPLLLVLLGLGGGTIDLGKEAPMSAHSCRAACRNRQAPPLEHIWEPAAVTGAQHGSL